MKPGLLALLAVSSAGIGTASAGRDALLPTLTRLVQEREPLARCGEQAAVPDAKPGAIVVRARLGKGDKVTSTRILIDVPAQRVLRTCLTELVQGLALGGRAIDELDVEFAVEPRGKTLGLKAKVVRIVSQTTGDARLGRIQLIDFASGAQVLPHGVGDGLRAIVLDGGLEVTKPPEPPVRLSTGDAYVLGILPRDTVVLARSETRLAVLTPPRDVASTRPAKGEPDDPPPSAILKNLAPRVRVEAGKTTPLGRGNPELADVVHVLSGKGTLTVGGVDVPLDGDTTVIVPGSVPHALTAGEHGLSSVHVFAKAGSSQRPRTATTTPAATSRNP